MNGLGLPSEVIAELARDLHKMGPATRRELREKFEALSGPLLSAARRNASWSSRIPSAISVKGIASEATSRVGLQLRISAAAAPHARPYEGLSAQGSTSYFRHPVYGNREVWRSQTSRPYAWPAVESQGPAASRACAEAVEAAAQAAGFR